MGRPPERSGARLRRRPARRHRCDVALTPSSLPVRAAGAVREQDDPKRLDGRARGAARAVARLRLDRASRCRSRCPCCIPRSSGRSDGRGRNAGGNQGRRSCGCRRGRAILFAGRGLLHDADAVESVPEMGAPVISALHELRKSEDGQTLVLAAIFGLVLMMCVLGTVNLGRAVYDKVQLQAAADEAAYSQAAVEARVMNYTAYTNRAMVVHYASIMAATAYLSWVHFMYGGFKPVLDVLKAVPFVQAVATVVDQVLSGLVTFLDSAVAVLVPLLSAANLLLWAVQEGAWASVYGKLLLAPTGWPEAHGGDTPAHDYQPIWPNIIPAMNATVFAQTRGQLTVPQAQAQSAKLLVNSSDADVQ